MVLKLYYDLLSQPSRAINIFLKTNKISFEPVRISLGRAEHKSEAYKQINPLQLVPVIDDNGFILKESVGILRYLCREYKVADHWYPKTSKEQAKIDEFLEWQHLGIRLGCGFYFRLIFVEPATTGKSPLESEINRYKKLMIYNCDLMENVWLKDTNSKYLFGNELSIADLLAAAEIEQPRLCGYDAKVGRPRLARFMENVKAATNPHYDEAHSLLEKLSSSFRPDSKL